MMVRINRESLALPVQRLGVGPQGDRESLKIDRTTRR
jgi:hypothetical protein